MGRDGNVLGLGHGWECYWAGVGLGLVPNVPSVVILVDRAFSRCLVYILQF